MVNNDDSVHVYAFAQIPSDIAYSCVFNQRIFRRTL